MKPVSRQPDPPKSAYIHIPFCKSKCAYCDFNSYAGMESAWDAYVEALLKEMERAARHGPLETVYFGGGTPTVLPTGSLIRVLEAVAGSFGLSPDAEISIEANPGTVSAESLRELRKAGFNRLSLGVQSFNDDLLRRIGRIHTAEEAVAAFDYARKAGFDNIGIDLIYSLSGQDMAGWEADLRKLVNLGPEHASLYELTICEDTPLGQEVLFGELAVPDGEAQVGMLLLGLRTLTKAGYERYEISNYAKPGFACRHNQAYWRYEEYHGFGAGACSFVDGVRKSNVKWPKEYIERVIAGPSPVEFSEEPDEKQRVVEVLMQALRTTEGLDLRAFEQRLGYALEDVHGDKLARMQERGLLTIADGRLLPTDAGILMADAIAAEFL